MRKLTFLALFALSSCCMGTDPATMERFYEVDLSTNSEQVIEMLGKPYAIHDLADGCQEYEYIERIKIGARDAEERHYFILIRNGQVVSKRVKQSGPLPYFMQWFDSYDMQTTQNEE